MAHYDNCERCDACGDCHCEWDKNSKEKYMKETIVVETNGKFGPKANGVWYSFSPKYKGEKQLVLGAPIDVDVFTAESGKKYINKVLAAGAIVAVPKETVKAAKEVAVKAVVDWDKKDRSQLVGGRSHDAVELVNASLVTGTPMADVLKLYKEALEGVLKIAEEVK